MNGKKNQFSLEEKESVKHQLLEFMKKNELNKSTEYVLAEIDSVESCIDDILRYVENDRANIAKEEVERLSSIAHGYTEYCGETFHEVFGIGKNQIRQVVGNLIETGIIEKINNSSSCFLKLIHKS